MRTVFAFVLLCSLAVHSAGIADTIESTATFNNVGVNVEFSSAPAPGTAVSMFVKEFGSPDPYAEAHPLSPIASDRYAGSLLQLESGTTYSIKLSSPAFATDQFLTVTTRSDSFPDATGTGYHVSTTGSDGNTGLDFGQSFATLAHALSVALAGDEILLHDGRYYEGGLVTPRSGAEAAPIIIRSAPGEHAVLDGTNQSFAPAWSLAPDETEVYVTSYSGNPRTAFIDGTHLYKYSNVSDLAADTWETNGGYYVDTATQDMYVRFPDGDAPAAYTVTVPQFSTALTIDEDYIQVRDVEIAYYGYDLYSRGIFIDGGDYNLVDNVDFHHNLIGVGIKRAADFNTIQNSQFNESPAGDWSFLAIKNGYEGGAIYIYDSTSPNSGNVIRNNVITNVGDGSHLYGNSSSPTTNMDFYGNIVTNAVDDGLETDGAGSNVRIYGNTFSGFLTGISVAPGNTGPTYIFRNVLANWDFDASGHYEGYPIKLNNATGLSTSWVYLYHNTAYTDNWWQNGFLFAGYSDWDNVIGRNNIWAGTLYAIESWPAADYDGEVDFDYDNLFTTDPTRFLKWAGVRYYSIPDFYAASGQEEHAIWAWPGFIDAGAGDFNLAYWSALIDQGLIIPGVNDGYFGDGPDIGAFEFFNIVPEPSAIMMLGIFALRLRRRRV